MTKDEAIKFLEDMANHFINKASNTYEDKEYWASVYNADNCRKIIKILKSNSGNFS
jgi:hypothetical protein